MEDSTTESECGDDAEELSTADVRWESSKSYLNIYCLQFTEKIHCILYTLYYSGRHYVVCSDTCTCSNYFYDCLLFRVYPSMPEYRQPKFVVFYGMLMNIFTLFCFKCKEAAPTVSVKCHGTTVTVTQHCLKRKDVFEWNSQPLVMGKYPAGIVLLGFAILMAGASISKVLLIFHHMGVSVYSGRTYFRHQHQFIFPTILHYWESYPAKLVDKLKKLKVVWTGDGRLDSMGHSAKYGAYTMLCTTIMKIMHFEVVQVRGLCMYCFMFSSGLLGRLYIIYESTVTVNPVNKNA